MPSETMDIDIFTLKYHRCEFLDKLIGIVVWLYAKIIDHEMNKFDWFASTTNNVFGIFRIHIILEFLSANLTN